MLTVAAATIAPPKRQVRPAKTKQKPKRYYTLHSHPNDTFAIKLGEDIRMSVVGFMDWDDAFFIGKMIETHFVRQKEWPDMTRPGSLTLPAAHQADRLHYVYIHQWDFEDLKVTCTKNFMDMISVENILKKGVTGYTFSGNVFKFEAPDDFYRQRIAELYEISDSRRGGA